MAQVSDWQREEAYCNCLLVATARVPIPKIDLLSDCELPDLEVLAASRPDLVAWIQKEEHNYSGVKSSAVIERLAQMAEISPILFWYWTGFLKVYDVAGSDDPVVQRSFSLHLSRRKNIFRLRIRLGTIHMVVSDHPPRPLT
ncbi:MAG TPA: hypothetical protein VI685_25090 [Candidatus Angelobacter sp.]